MLYILIIIFLLFCVYWYDYKNRTIGKEFFYFSTFLILVLVLSLRHRVGGDALTYEEMYPDMPTLLQATYFIQYENWSFYMPFWIYLVSLTRSLSENIILFHILHALLFNTAIFIFIKRYSSKPFSVLLLFFASLIYFYFSIEIQREALAIAFFVLNIKNLENKRWLKYYLLATISFLFHISAIILFVLPLFKLIKFNRSFVIGSLIATLFIALFKNIIMDFFSIFLILDSMKAKADVYSTFNFSLLGFLSYFAVRVLLFLPFVIYLYTEKKENLKYKWFYSSFLVISILAQFFVGFERFLNYLYPLYIVIIIDFLYIDFPKMKSVLVRNFITFCVLLNLFFVIEYKLFIKNQWGQHYYALFFPYNSVFNPQINDEREDFYSNLW